MTGPQTFIDSPERWARQFFPSKQNATSEAITGEWLSHLQNSSESSTHNQWLAYQILKGDVSNWSSAINTANWELIKVQSEQLQAFISNFFHLSPELRRLRFAELEKSLQNNAVALHRLHTVRPLLELDSLHLDSISSDMQILILSAAKLRIENPSNRRIEYEKIMAMVTSEPARWEAAATQIRTLVPNINDIAPDLFLRIATFRADQKQFRSKEKASLRRTLLARTRLFISGSHFLKTAIEVYIGLVVLGVVISAFTDTTGSLKPSNVVPETWDLSDEQKRAFGKLPEQPKPPIGFTRFAEDIILHPEKYPQEMRIIPPPSTLIESTAIYVRTWEKIARLEGMNGLDKEEMRLRAALEQLNGQASAANPDDAISSNAPTADPLENKAVRMRLQLLLRWREKEGNRLARTRDTVEKLKKGNEGHKLPLQDLTEGDRDE